MVLKRENLELPNLSNGVMNISGYLKSLFFIIIAFYLLNTAIEILGIRVALSNIAIMLGLMLAMCRKSFYKKNIIFKESVLTFFLCMTALTLYAAANELYFSESNGEFYFSKIIINVLVCSMFSLIFSAYLVKSNVTLPDILLLIFYVGLLNSAIVVLSFFISDFRTFIESILFQQINSNINYETVDWRLRGLAAAGGASLSIFTAFCLVIGMICNKMKLISSNAFLFYSVIMISSQFFVARTGLMISIVFILIWFFEECSRIRLSFFIWFSFIVVSVTWLFSVFSDDISRVLPFALELFYNVLSGEQVATGSTNELIDMLYFPNDPHYFLLGFGCFEGCGYYRSDSGYFKSISAVGVFFSLSIYFFIFYILFFWVVKFIGAGTLYWRLLVIILFIAEVKEPFLYQNYVARSLILLVFFCVCTKANDRKHKC